MEAAVPCLTRARRFYSVLGCCFYTISIYDHLSIKYKLEENQFLKISSTVLATLLRYRQQPGADEAGGILLGRIYPHSSVTIEVATEPGPDDKAGPRLFFRHPIFAQKIINEAWYNSQREQIYLGEWHSHRESYPYPSRQDRRMIRSMFRETRMEISFLFLIIVGIKEIWVGVENGQTLRELAPSI